VTSAMWANSGPAGPAPDQPGRPADPGPVGGGLGGLGGLLPAGRQKPGRFVMTPARRAAILIGVPIVFIIFITSGYSVVSNTGTGSFPVSESVAIPNGKLTMNLGGGGAKLQGSDAMSATARISGTVSYHLARPSLSTQAGGISLRCPKVDTGNCSLNATVDVPAGIALSVGTGGGDLTASGLSGGATVTTDGGNISLTDVTGGLALNSGGGNVQASHVSGQAVTISADGGDITGSAITASRLVAGSGGGDVRLTLSTSPRHLEVTTDGGNVTIVVPSGRYVVNTSAGGGTISAIPSSAGAADVITVSSGGGDISITD
jgi:Toastrack DUF4097